jgi:hypothetical protein
MNNALEAIQKYADQLRKYADDIVDIAPQAIKLQPTLDMLARYHQIHLTATIGKITLNVKVKKSLAEMLPLLETIEAATGAEFDKTEDWGEYAMRDFKSSKAPWLEISATVPTSGEQCRTEIVGYKEVPIYEIKCEGEEP